MLCSEPVCLGQCKILASFVNMDLMYLYIHVMFCPIQKHARKYQSAIYTSKVENIHGLDMKIRYVDRNK